MKRPHANSVDCINARIRSAHVLPVARPCNTYVYRCKTCVAQECLPVSLALVPYVHRTNSVDWQSLLTSRLAACVRHSRDRCALRLSAGRRIPAKWECWRFTDRHMLLTLSLFSSSEVNCAIVIRSTSSL
jgi:hypothetical protein